MKVLASLDGQTHLKALVNTENCMNTQCYSFDFWHNLSPEMILSKKFQSSDKPSGCYILGKGEKPVPTYRAVGRIKWSGLCVCGIPNTLPRGRGLRLLPTLVQCFLFYAYIYYITSSHHFKTYLSFLDE